MYCFKCKILNSGVELVTDTLLSDGSSFGRFGQ